MANLPNISANIAKVEKDKTYGSQMVTHLRISLGLQLLNFRDLTIHSHCLYFCVMLHACIVQILAMGDLFHKGIYRIPSLNASIRAQHKNEPIMRSAKFYCSAAVSKKLNCQGATASEIALLFLG